RFVLASIATTDGSEMTMPRSRTCTSVFAVPRSMPMSREKRPSRRSSMGTDRFPCWWTRGGRRGPAGSAAGRPRDWAGGGGLAGARGGAPSEPEAVYGTSPTPLPDAPGGAHGAARHRDRYQRAGPIGTSWVLFRLVHLDEDRCSPEPLPGRTERDRRDDG